MSAPLSGTSASEGSQKARFFEPLQLPVANPRLCGRFEAPKPSKSCFSAPLCLGRAFAALKKNFHFRPKIAPKCLAPRGQKVADFPGFRTFFKHVPRNGVLGQTRAEKSENMGNFCNRRRQIAIFMQNRRFLALLARFRIKFS